MFPWARGHFVFLISIRGYVFFHHDKTLLLHSPTQPLTTYGAEGCFQKLFYAQRVSQNYVFTVASGGPTRILHLDLDLYTDFDWVKKDQRIYNRGT